MLQQTFGNAQLPEIVIGIVNISLDFWTFKIKETILGEDGKFDKSKDLLMKLKNPNWERPYWERMASSTERT